MVVVIIMENILKAKCVIHTGIPDSVISCGKVILIGKRIRNLGISIGAILPMNTCKVDMTDMNRLIPK